MCFEWSTFWSAVSAIATSLGAVMVMKPYCERDAENHDGMKKDTGITGIAGAWKECMARQRRNMA